MRRASPEKAGTAGAAQRAGVRRMARNIKIVPLLLSVVAGMGHLWEGKDLKGLALFALFAAGMAGVLEGLVLWAGPGKIEITIGAAIVVAGVWCYAFVDIVRLTYRPWREKIRLRRSEHLRRGILSFLKGEHADAERELLANLRLEPGDPESLFRLAVLCRLKGDFGRARRYLRALKRTDAEEKWAWERVAEESLIEEAEKKKPAEARQ
ncbi:MAG TPA: hypothetical protein PLR66_10200 [Planctomycetota bacterium]|nr:hypothetical protein [Planctomycetota bacterium]